MVGEKILQIRKRFNLTRNKFSKLINYSASYLKDIESGKVKPSREFIETISKNFDVSIDSLLKDSLIMEAIDERRGKVGPEIIFLYAFRQNDIDCIEEILKELLADRKILIIDASILTNSKQVYSVILNKKVGSYESILEVEKLLVTEELMIIIKNLKASKIPKKDKGGVVRDLFKMIEDYDVRKIMGKGFENIDSSKSIIIVLDFPSFLEDHFDTIGYYARPIYPLSEIESYLEKKDNTLNNRDPL